MKHQARDYQHAHESPGRAAGQRHRVRQQLCSALQRFVQTWVYDTLTEIRLNAMAVARVSPVEATSRVIQFFKLASFNRDISAEGIELHVGPHVARHDEGSQYQ